MRVELILEAIDRASAVINRVREAGKAANTSLHSDMSKLATTANYDMADEVLTKRVGAASQGLFGAAAAFTAAAAPVYKAIQEANKFQDSLTDIGLKAGIAGDKLGDFGQVVRSQALALNMASTDILGGIDKLMAGGLNVDTATAIFPALSKAALASKADMDDLSKSAVSLINNLKIDPTQITRTLDAMAQSGKDGQFEMKDMAQFFPKVAAQYAAMGQSGHKAVVDLASALQIMRMNTSDASTAVTNLQDLLLKPTMTQGVKAFDKYGIDINAEMEKARKNGTVLETLHRLIEQATKGDQSKLQTLFTDKQALAGAQALMQHWDEYIKLQQSAADASGVVDRDFATRMGLGVERARALKVALVELSLSLGQALAPMAGAGLEGITHMLQAVNQFVGAHPKLTAAIAAIMLSFSAFNVVMAAGRLGLALTAKNFISVMGLFWRFNEAGKNVALFARLFHGLGMLGTAVGRFAGTVFTTIAQIAARASGFGSIITAVFARLGGVFRLLLSPLAMAARGFMMLGASIMATPVGWILAALVAIAAAAYLIYRNWGAIGPWLAGLWARIRAAMAAAWAGIVSFARTLGSRVLAALVSGWAAVKNWFGSIQWPSLPDMVLALVSPFAGLLTLFDVDWGRIKAWFAAIEWPSLPAFPDVLGAIKAALDPVIGFVTEWGKTLGGALDTAFTAIGDGLAKVGDKLADAGTAVGKAWTSAKNFVTGNSAPATAQASAAPAQAPAVMSVADATATVEQAQAAQRALKNIAPAAQEAVARAGAILVAANFESHGVAMMRTLAAGIRAGAAQAVAAVRETVAQIRDYLPHSPAKVGPLSDLDRVRFGQTLATAIHGGTPHALAAVRLMAAGMLAALPASPSVALAANPPAMAVPAAPQFSESLARGAPGRGSGVSGGAAITVNLTVNASGGGADFIAQLKANLPRVGHELAAVIATELERRERTKH